MTPQQFVRMLRSLPGAVASADVSELHRSAGETFREIQEENFQRASDDNDVPWPPRKHHYPWPILRKTLKMMKAASVRGAPGNIDSTRGRILALGIRSADVHYAKFHQFGTARLPRRRFLYLKRKDWSRLHPAARRHLRRILDQARARYGGTAS